jgi:hypothetical protein
MKTIIKTLCFCAILNAEAQEKKDTTKKVIQPLIISTDIFAPLSIGVEKIFNENHAIKIRAFHLLPEGATEYVKDKSRSSLFIQYKYYPKKLILEDLNLYAGLYSKYRRGILEEKLRDTYGNDIGINKTIQQSLFMGLQGGFHYILGPISIDANAGLGINTLYKPNNGLNPYDSRANLSVGFAIY